MKPAAGVRYGIRLLGLADGTPTPLDGKWLCRYEPLKWEMRELSSMDELVAALDEWVATTDDPAQALEFETPVAAFEFRQQVGKGTRPWDGRRNRPLTAFSIEVTKLPLPEKEA